MGYAHNWAVKDRTKVDGIDFSYVYDESQGTIEKTDFDEWHHQQVVKLREEFKHKKLP